MPTPLNIYQARIPPPPYLPLPWDTYEMDTCSPDNYPSGGGLGSEIPTPSFHQKDLGQEIPTPNPADRYIPIKTTVVGVISISTLKELKIMQVEKHTIL